jgi:hypothetical protein
MTTTLAEVERTITAQLERIGRPDPIEAHRQAAYWLRFHAERHEGERVERHCPVCRTEPFFHSENRMDAVGPFLYPPSIGCGGLAPTAATLQRSSRTSS